MAAPIEPIAIFGPTGVGKTAVAIALAERLRSAGEDPLAISCDSIAVYRGLELISGAPDEAERRRLEHRLIGIAGLEEEFNAGRFAALAEEQVVAALADGRRPLIVGGTGLYMRAALNEIELRPPVEAEIRERVEREVAERGSPALHAELAADVAGRVHPNDRKRVARALELQRSGIDPPERSRELWSSALRRPTTLIGLVCDRETLAERIRTRVEAMARHGAGEEARAALALGPSRTAAAAIGLEAFARGDLDRVAAEHRRYARRQMTWLRKTPELELIEVDALTPVEVAERITALLGNTARR